MEIKDLIELYASASTEKAKAEVEFQIWEQANLEQRQLGRDKFLASLLGCKSYESNIRGKLFNLGAAADPLWVRLDQDLTLKTAGDIVIEGRKSNHPLDQAILQELAAYDSRPHKRVLKDGKVIRTGTYSAVGRNKIDNKSQSPNKNVWKQIRNELSVQFSKLVDGLHPAMQQELYNDFETELKVLFESYQGKVYRFRKSAESPPSKITQYKVNQACTVLNIPEPTVHEKVDLSLAKKMKNKLANLYHPDKHSDPEIKKSMKVRFQEIIEAYTTIESYNEGIKG